MKENNINNYTRGWIVGSFAPSLCKTDTHELGIKYYKLGDKEAAHKHNLSDEITIIAYGVVKINGKEYKEGDIIVQEKGDSADFEVLSEKAITVVYRPDGSFPNDKIFV